MKTRRASAAWQRIRRVWATLGSVAFVGFVVWCLIAYRASAAGRAGLISDSLVRINEGDGRWRFAPSRPGEPTVNLLFLPGALVEPEAYAPLLHALAARGYPGYLIALPGRGAFGMADGEDFLARARSLIDTIPGAWVIAGHSRGAKIAALLARRPTSRMTGLILLGTTHPRDFSLADTRLAVTKIYGTADGVSSAGDVLANAVLLPAATRWVAIDGGNHSQFGYYGFQPGDRRAAISRADQQAAILRAMVVALESARTRSTPPGD